MRSVGEVSITALAKIGAGLGNWNPSGHAFHDFSTDSNNDRQLIQRSGMKSGAVMHAESISPKKRFVSLNDDRKQTVKATHGLYPNKH